MEYIIAALVITNGLSAVAALTPTDSDDKALGRIKNLLLTAKKFLSKF